MADVHPAQPRIEEHAEHHQEVDSAHADDGLDQPSSLHRDTGKQRSDRDRRLRDRGERPEDPSQQVRRRVLLGDGRKYGVDRPERRASGDGRHDRNAEGRRESEGSVDEDGSDHIAGENVRRRGHLRPTDPNSNDPATAPAPNEPTSAPKLAGLP